MDVIVTIKSFDDELHQFNNMLPMVEQCMQSAITQLAILDDNPIDLSNLKSIHFTDNFREELFEFQKSVGIKEHATLNNLGRGYAQVVYVGSPNADELCGYHIFCDKQIALVIMVGQFIEDNFHQFTEEVTMNAKKEKLYYLRALRHELAHVEDETNQKKWIWFEHAFDQDGVKSSMRQIALRMWEEYYACRRSMFFDDRMLLEDELISLYNHLDLAEREICELRWKYNTREIDLNDFITSFGDYLRTALFFCCYFMGHHDQIYEIAVGKVQLLTPSRFVGYIPELWKHLREMSSTYPNWSGVEVFDSLSKTIGQCINGFEIYLREERDGIYYDIPEKRLKPLSENIVRKVH